VRSVSSSSRSGACAPGSSESGSSDASTDAWPGAPLPNVSPAAEGPEGLVAVDPATTAIATAAAATPAVTRPPIVHAAPVAVAPPDPPAPAHPVPAADPPATVAPPDRKSTRLNSSH